VGRRCYLTAHGNHHLHGARELAAGQRQQLRELGQAAWRPFLFHYYRKAYQKRTAREIPLVLLEPASPRA
jgi:hypothetical protein